MESALQATAVAIPATHAPERATTVSDNTVVTGGVTTVNVYYKDIDEEKKEKKLSYLESVQLAAYYALQLGTHYAAVQSHPHEYLAGAVFGALSSVAQTPKTPVDKPDRIFRTVAAAAMILGARSIAFCGYIPILKEAQANQCPKSKIVNIGDVLSFGYSFLTARELVTEFLNPKVEEKKKGDK